MKNSLREHLLEAGATVVGFASVGGALDGRISHLARAVSIGVERNLSEDTVSLLRGLQAKAERFLRKKEYRFLCIPPDSDRRDDTFVSVLYQLLSHKMAATSAGIGWIGKNGLLISPEFGPRLSLATVLTDAPLEPDFPFEESMCGECSLCVEHCPSGAIQGQEWSRDNPFPRLIETDRCRSHKRTRRLPAGKPNCGLCINICPYGRKQTAEEDPMPLKKRGGP